MYRKRAATPSVRTALFISSMHVLVLLMSLLCMIKYDYIKYDEYDKIQKQLDGDIMHFCGCVKRMFHMVCLAHSVEINIKKIVFYLSIPCK